jgi:hypothetical protein
MPEPQRITREIRSPSVNVVGALLLQGARPLGVTTHAQSGARMERFAATDQPLLDAYNRARDRAADLLNGDEQHEKTQERCAVAFIPPECFVVRGSPELSWLEIVSGGPPR